MKAELAKSPSLFLELNASMNVKNISTWHSPVVVLALKVWHTGKSSVPDKFGQLVTLLSPLLCSSDPDFNVWPQHRYKLCFSG